MTTSTGRGFPMVQGPWHDGGMFVGMHWVWWLFWILTFCLLVWGVVSALSDQSKSRRALQRRDSAEEELRTRFAKGEIDDEELNRRLRVLRATQQDN